MHAYTCAYVHTCTRTHAYMYTQCTHAYPHAHTCVHTHAYTYTHAYTGIHAHTCTYMHTYVHVCACTYVCTRACIQICMHIYVCVWVKKGCWTVYTTWTHLCMCFKENVNMLWMHKRSEKVHKKLPTTAASGDRIRKLMLMGVWSRSVHTSLTGLIFLLWACLVSRYVVLLRLVWSLVRQLGIYHFTGWSLFLFLDCSVFFSLSCCLLHWSVFWDHPPSLIILSPGLVVAAVKMTACILDLQKSRINQYLSLLLDNKRTFKCFNYIPPAYVLSFYFYFPRCPHFTLILSGYVPCVQNSSLAVPFFQC